MEPSRSCPTERIRRFYECYTNHDFEAMKHEVLAEDVTWLIPGHHPLAGIKRGADEIIAYFDTLSETNFQAELISLSASEDWVVDLHRGWGHYGELSLDIIWVLAYRIEAGRIKEVRNFAQDSHAAVALAAVVAGGSARSSPAAPHSANVTLPAAVRCYRDAVNRANLADLTLCFKVRGVVIDVSRASSAETRFVSGRAMRSSAAA